MTSLTAWQPHDIIVAALAFSVCFALILTAIFPYITKTPPSDERSRSIGALVAAIIAIISLYIGLKMD